MRIEIMGGFGALGVSTFQTDFEKYIKKSEDVISTFKAIKTATYNICGGVSDTIQNAIEHVEERIREESEKIQTAIAIQKKSNDFVDLVERVDSKVATLVNKNKDAFYDKYPHLKPVEPKKEKTYGYILGALCSAGDALQDFGEKVVDGVQKAVDWTRDTLSKLWDAALDFYNEHKKIIDTILIVAGAVASIAAVVASGGGALVFLLGALGCSGSVAAAISGAVAVVAVVSTVASSAMNIVDIWAEIDNPSFEKWKTGLNIVSGVSNALYSVGEIYNTFNKISPQQAKSAMKTLLSNDRGTYVAGQYVPFASDLPGNFGCDKGINRSMLTDADPGVFYSVPNKSGGNVYVSVNPTQGSGMDVVDLVNNTPGHINILSGTHGDELGGLFRERSFFNTDFSNFSTYSNVDVYDIFSLSPRELNMIVNSPGTTVCAWCFSERSVDILSLLR